jgi:hypothetical protein
VSTAEQRFRALALTVLLVATEACDTLLVSAPASDTSLADFEAAWTWVDSVYPVFQEKGLDWDSVHAVYRPLAEAAQGDEIRRVLSDLLAVPRDGHLYLTTRGGGPLYPYIPTRLLRDRHTFSALLVPGYLDAPLQRPGGGAVEYGTIGGDVGYVRIASFDPDAVADDFGEVMDALRSTSGLILDVRNNNGGDADNVAAVVSRFIASTMTWLDGVEANGVPFEPWDPIEPDAGHDPYSNPVVVLINGASISAAEILAETMRQLPAVTLVGDTTAGAGCNDRDETPGDRTLPSGIRIHIPTGCLFRYDGVPIEWNGVPPDVPVTQSQADITAGHDRQLEYALTLVTAAAGSKTSDRGCTGSP